MTCDPLQNDITPKYGVIASAVQPAMFNPLSGEAHGAVFLDMQTTTLRPVHTDRRPFFILLILAVDLASLC